jgi:hypothetical protein
MLDRRAIPLAFAGLALMLAVACQGCGGWPGPRLTAGNPNPSMGGFPAVSPAHHALLGSMFLCLTEPGQAVITKVRPIHPTGTIEVVGYAARPNPLLTGTEMLGSAYGTLRSHGFTRNKTVDTRCGSTNSGQGYELALELAVPPGMNAGTTAWEIDYRVGGHAASVNVPAGRRSLLHVEYRRRPVQTCLAEVRGPLVSATAQCPLDRDPPVGAKGAIRARF